VVYCIIQIDLSHATIPIVDNTYVKLYKEPMMKFHVEYLKEPMMQFHVEDLKESMNEHVCYDFGNYAIVIQFTIYLWKTL